MSDAECGSWRGAIRYSPSTSFFPVFSQSAVKVEFSRVAGFCQQLVLFLQSYMYYSGLSRGKREGIVGLVASRNKFPIAEWKCSLNAIKAYQNNDGFMHSSKYTKFLL